MIKRAAVWILSLSALGLSPQSFAQSDENKCKSEAKKLADQILQRDQDALSLKELKDQIKATSSGDQGLEQLKENERMITNKLRVRDNKIKRLAAEVKTLCEDVENVEGVTPQ